MKAASSSSHWFAPRVAAVFGLTMVLLAVASCGVRPMAPTLPTPGSGGVAFRAAAERAAEAPEIREVRIQRHGGEVDFAIVRVPGSEAERLPLDAYPAAGSSWTFRLRLDTDQNPFTGDSGGAEYELDLMPGNVLTLYRQSWTGSQVVATVPYRDQPGALTFSIPMGQLGGDEGWMDYSLQVYEILVLNGEREYLRATTLHGTNNALPDESRQVPIVRDLRTEIRGDTLFMRGQLHPRDSSYQTFYDPGRAGGWCLQLLLNTDQARTGYSLGYDYIVCGVEWDAAGAFVVRRIAPADDNWGPVSGAARFEIRPRTFELAVPLAAIGGDDGILDYVLEQYATVECPLCEGGVAASSTVFTFGSTGPSSHHHALAMGPLERVGLECGARIEDHGVLARIRSDSPARRMQLR